MKTPCKITTSVLLLLASQVSAQTIENSSVRNVMVEATGSTSVQVTWNSLAGAAYYDVYQNGDRIETLVAETSLDVFSHQPGTFYQYFVTGSTIKGGRADANGFCNSCPRARPYSSKW